MIRKVALFGLCLILTACGRPSAPRPFEPCPPILETDAEAEPAARGTIVQPVTPEEIEATAGHLGSDAAARDWGREGWRRAGVARDWCRERREAQS